jgi:hypothetical protein
MGQEVLHMEKLEVVWLENPQPATSLGRQAALQLPSAQQRSGWGEALL